MPTIIFPGFAFPLGRNILWRVANVFLKLSVVAGQTRTENIFWNLFQKIYYFIEWWFYKDMRIVLGIVFLLTGAQRLTLHPKCWHSVQHVLLL